MIEIMKVLLTTDWLSVRPASIKATKPGISYVWCSVLRSLKAKFHYTSWFGASSDLASVMEFGFNHATAFHWCSLFTYIIYIITDNHDEVSRNNSKIERIYLPSKMHKNKAYTAHARVLLGQL